MTVSFGSAKNIISKEIPLYAGNYVADQSTDVYVRPSDWLTLPALAPSGQAFYGLIAIANDDSNFVALSAGSTGTVLVDWGDGTSDTVASNAQVNHYYDYNTISAATQSTRGYRQAIVTVTPIGGNLTNINLQLKYIGTAAPNTAYIATARWLDIKFGGPSLNSFTIGSNGPIVWLGMLEQIELTNGIVGGFNLLNAFRNLVKLQNVIWPQNIPVISASGAFFSCLSLVNAPVLPFSGPSPDFSGMFTLCRVLKYVPNYNFSNVTNAKCTSMFDQCVSLLSAPAFTGTTTITDTASMFSNCTALLYVPNYDLSNVTTVSGMFSGCVSLVTAPNLNTKNVTNFNQMFNGCTALKTVPAYDMGNATIVTSQFQLCTALETLPSFNLPKLQALSNMFLQCSSLTSIGTIVTTGNLISMIGTFNSCTSLSTPPTITNTSNVTNMSFTYATCRALQSIPAMDTSKVTNMSNTFNTCTALEFAPVMNTAAVTNMESMFSGCVSLKTVPDYNTGNLLNLSNAFNTCRSLTTLPNLNLINCTNMVSAFNACSSLLDANGISNTGNVTTVAGIFNGCISLMSAPNISTDKVTSFNTMYNSCYGIVTIPAYNMTNATSATNFINNSYEVGNVLVANCKVSVNYSSCKLGKVGLENVFNNLGSPATSQTITINGNPGADPIITRTSCTINAGQPVINSTGIQAAGVTVDMYGIGTNVSGTLSVQTNSSTDRITSTQISFTDSALGSRVSFTTTANGFTAYLIYYIVAVEFGLIKVSLTPGGAPVNITGDATMNMNFENRVISVSANTVTMAIPCSATATQTVTFRKVNTNIARLKNWTISG